jgi:NAD(P)-dependent dehydrogenase (short-subunit alcohol dehydrogenase family)
VFGIVYSPSKTALNAITLAFALELESTRIKVNAACPGFTATHLHNFEGRVALRLTTSFFTWL